MSRHGPAGAGALAVRRRWVRGRRGQGAGTAAEGPRCRPGTLVPRSGEVGGRVHGTDPPPGRGLSCARARAGVPGEVGPVDGDGGRAQAGGGHAAYAGDEGAGQMDDVGPVPGNHGGEAPAGRAPRTRGSREAEGGDADDADDADDAAGRPVAGRPAGGGRDDDGGGCDRGRGGAGRSERAGGHAVHAEGRVRSR